MINRAKLVDTHEWLHEEHANITSISMIISVVLRDHYSAFLSVCIGMRACHIFVYMLRDFLF